MDKRLERASRRLEQSDDLSMAQINEILDILEGNAPRGKIVYADG